MFELDKNDQVIIPAHFFLLDVFKELKRLYKDRHYKAFAYVFYLADFKSPYRLSQKIEDIPAMLVEDLDMKGMIIGEAIARAIDKYKELQQVKSLKIFDAADKALSQVTDYFNNFDSSTLPIEKKDDIVNKVMKNLSEVGTLVTALETARKKVEQDISDKKLKGSQIIRAREIPNNNKIKR